LGILIHLSNSRVFYLGRHILRRSRARRDRWLAWFEARGCAARIPDQVGDRRSPWRFTF